MSSSPPSWSRRSSGELSGTASSTEEFVHVEDQDDDTPTTTSSSDDEGVQLPWHRQIVMNPGVASPELPLTRQSSPQEEEEEEEQVEEHPSEEHQLSAPLPIDLAELEEAAADAIEVLVDEPDVIITEDESASPPPSATSSPAPSSNAARVKLSCAVCRKAFTTAEPQDSCEVDHRPRLLAACRHAVCGDCCRKELERASKSGGQFKCPLDLTEFSFANLSEVPIYEAALKSVQDLNSIAEYRLASRVVHGDVESCASPESATCDECDLRADFYCTRCDASLCETHTQTKLQAKHRTGGLIVPMVERRIFLARASASGAVGLCKVHLLPESLLCTLDDSICCQTCSLHSVEHRDHASQVITVVEAAESNARRMKEACELNTQQQLEAEIEQAQQVQKDATAFERNSIESIQSEFSRLEDRLRTRQDVLLKEVAEKAEFLRSSAAAREHECRALLLRLTHAHNVSACLVPLRSSASLAHSASVLAELESIQSAYSSFLLQERSTIKGEYLSSFKPIMSELLRLGVVPDIRTSKEEGAGSQAHSPIGWQSRILTRAKDIESLHSLLGTSSVLGRLVYRGTRDGFSASDFHSRCDKVGATLTLIRARESGYIFGVYSVVEYESCDAGAWLVDPTGLSCIVSLTNAHQRPLRLQSAEHERAMYVKSERGPMVGGRDIAMSAQFDQPGSNSCAPGAYASVRTFQAHSRTAVPEVQYDAHLLAGSPQWSCSEVEVYSVAPFGLLQVLHSSTILRMLDLPHLSRFLGRSQPVTSAQLLYRVSRDGFTAADFRRTCLDSGRTLTLIRVAGSNFVFGAYSAVAFPQVPAGRFSTPVVDDSGDSFLFSLVNAYRRPLKLKLRPGSYAIYSHAHHGPVFGGSAMHSPDIILGVRDDSQRANNRHATLPFSHQAGNSVNTPRSFAIDEACEAEAGLPHSRHSGVVHDRRLLAGKALFAIKDMEIYQLA